MNRFCSMFSQILQLFSRTDFQLLVLEQYLDTEPAVKPIERVRNVLGRVESGIPDLGRRHRDYLIRRLRRGR